VVAVSIGPVNRIAVTRLFSVHMGQHVVLLDLAPLVLALAFAGMTGLARVHPLPVLILWTASLYAWHIPRLYDAALRHAAVHGLQHVCFLGTGVLLWSAVLGSRPVGWRLGSVAAAGLASAVLGNVFLWAGHSFFTPYVEAPRLWGLSALTDQRLGGVVMLAEGSLVMVGAAAWIVLRWAAEPERA
jgi:cytochrome c oxidase assembly factor CtaG